MISGLMSKRSDKTCPVRVENAYCNNINAYFAVESIVSATKRSPSRLKSFLVKYLTVAPDGLRSSSSRGRRTRESNIQLEEEL